MRHARLRPVLLIAAAGAALALGACSGGDKAATGDADQSAAAGGEQTAQAPGAPGAEAAGPGVSAPPARKAGLWKISVSGPASVSMSQCVDATSDNLTAQAAMQQQGQSSCAMGDAHRELGGDYVFSSTCDMGGGAKVETKGRVTGDMSSHYVMTIQNTTTNAANPGMSAAQTMTLTGDYQGPCPSGMMAGDVMGPGGQVIHMPMAK